ncbi:MAG TPA: DNA-binding domain-containing protein [Hypericibacter adhaerens]|uniref:HvfC/BufC N-terminal domain-containing protein n=1 Tax=Hypericibacter adhaerens TaxID=2602016 RepID=UPI002B701AD7|nr:DNA-binding domain-containing protein [Hypericibacter adhaerens]HWA41954.1 DNA-binding domain-containing protein [Hypericibacter adhaerens]
MCSSARLGRDNPMPARSPSLRSVRHAEAAVAAARGLDERQRQFAMAILDPDMPVPPGLVGPDGAPSAKRFAVYRNNVVAGLVEALRAAFPALRRIVGDEFFSAMARIYAAQEPPRSPIMLAYGAGFADFVGAFAPAQGLPYLRDVARLERAWAEAYHAPEARPIDPAALGRVRPDRLPCIRFVLHPSLRIVRSPFPVLTLWQTNIGDGMPSAVDIAGGGEDILVIRAAAEVELRALPAGAARFIQALATGAPVADATALALGDEPGFDLARALRGLLEAGAMVGWNLPEERSFSGAAGSA